MTNDTLAAKLRTDALFIFDGANCAQETRDVIEWFTASLAVAAQALPAAEPVDGDDDGDITGMVGPLPETGWDDLPKVAAPTLPIYIRIDAPQDWAQRGDMQGLVEREIKADRWLWLATPQAAQQAAQATAGWVSVADRLPKIGVEVLIAFDGIWIAATGQYTGSPYDKHGWCYPSENNGCGDNSTDPVVTHWQPLPTPPAALPQPQPQSAQAKGDA